MRGLSSSGSVSPFASAMGLPITTSVTFSGANPTSVTTAERMDSMSDATRSAHASYSIGKWIRKCGVTMVRQRASGPCANAGTTRIAARANALMLVMHGGAGTIARSSMTPEIEAQYRETLAAALRSGHAVLAKRGSSLDAVQATIVVLEDSRLFNAGRGSVFTDEGTHQMDAAIMDGRTMKAGAVANVSNIRNP